MFKHIFKENRHNSINFDMNSQIMLDSAIDFSDLSRTQKQGDMSAFGHMKSRQGTADNYGT